MECDHLAFEQEYLVARCGMGAAFMMFQFVEGEEELTEVGFIDLENKTDQGSQKQGFWMKGGQQMQVEVPGEALGRILVVERVSSQLSVQVFKY